MTKFKVEFVRRGGWEEPRTRTVNIPHNVENLQDYIMHKIYIAMEPSPKYRSTESAFWREWELLQYYKA